MTCKDCGKELRTNQFVRCSECRQTIYAERRARIKELPWYLATEDSAVMKQRRELRGETQKTWHKTTLRRADKR